LAGSLLALSPGWIAWGRSSVTDMFLASAITVALLGFLLVYQAGFSTPSQQSRNQERLGYGCMALFSAIAVLAKGPVGLLLPGLVILLFLVLKGELLSQIRKTPWLPMAALFLGVTLPWYCQATVANGFDFISRFIGYSNFQRFTSVIYSHPGPPWFYIPWVFLFLLPWSLYLPVAVIRLRFWKLLTWRQSSFTADPSLFGLVWLVCMVAFYSAAATKLAGYILPVVPAGVLIVSLLFQPISGQRPLGLGMGISGWFNVLILALTAIASAVFPKFLRHNPDYPFFATALIHSGLQLWLPLIFGLTVVGLVWILLRPQAMPLVWLPNATALSVLLAFAVPALLPLIDRQRLQPIRSIGAVAGELLQSGDVLAVVGFKRYSLLYYSNRPALFVTTRDELFEAIPDHKAVKNIFLFGTDRELHRFGLNPSQCRSTGCQIVARRDAHLLIRTSLADFPKGS
jgi:4-amino-4-deoxy-L-arabinose transferase-like glycosyltransferase